MPPNDQRVAVVTGGSRGIGAAICGRLADEGFVVTNFDLEKPNVSAHHVEWQEVDVGDTSRLVDAVHETAEARGELDLVVNNAGKSIHQKLSEVSEEEWDRVIAVNLKAAFFAVQAAAPYLQLSNGRVVNISSELAHLGSSTLPHYSAAKGGLLSLTRSLARELAPSVLVNVVVPGPVDTEMFKRSPQFSADFGETLPIGRLPEPDDIASTVAFLAGRGGDVYTGQQFNANGGLVMV
jgi:3-oxoacyl-[acyl-carrier protein] reductase